MNELFEAVYYQHKVLDVLDKRISEAKGKNKNKLIALRILYEAMERDFLELQHLQHLYLLERIIKDREKRRKRSEEIKKFESELIKFLDRISSLTKEIEKDSNFENKEEKNS